MIDLPSLIKKFVVEREKTPRDKGNHPSEISSDFRCDRRAVIQLVADEKGADGAESPNWESEGFFDAGHAVHHWFQEQVLGPMGVLYGSWECRACHNRHEGKMGTCLCGSTDFKFHETKIRIMEYDIVGSIDGLIDDPDTGERMLCDIKSHKSSTFTGLKAASPGHVGQAMVYMRALGVKKGSILYVKKDCWYDTKQFNFDYDEDEFQRVIKEGIYDIQEAYEAGKLPPMPRKCTDGSWTRGKCWVSQWCLGCKTCDDVRHRIDVGLPRS